jgi:hypothetical protein
MSFIEWNPVPMAAFLAAHSKPTKHAVCHAQANEIDQSVASAGPKSTGRYCTETVRAVDAAH